MSKLTTQQAAAKYYSRIGSRLGYLLVMKRSQHFGYYDDLHTDEDSAQDNYHKKFAAKLKLKSGMRLLDAGCGQGVVACYLAKNYGVKVTGITITPYEVKVAKKRARKMGVDHLVDFLLADYACPPFEAETFDRIYTTETLSHAVDVCQVVQALGHLLSPNGLLVCAEYEMHFRDFDPSTQALAELVKDRAAIHGIYQFERGQFVSYLKKTGLVDVAEEDWTRNLKPSFDRLRLLAKPLSSLVRKHSFKKYFVNTMAASMYADGVESGTFAYKIYTARKPCKRML